MAVLDLGTVDLLIEAAGDELAERGLGVNDEPTEYGSRLESLIDVLLRIKLKSE